MHLRTVLIADPPAAIASFDDVDEPRPVSRIGIVIDGKEIAAQIDTGSSRSLFSLDEAQRLFGFDASALAALQEDGLGRRQKYPFKALTFGGVSVANPDIILVPDAESRLHGPPHIILGMGILRQLHLYISYREKKLYVTPASAH